MITPEKLSRLTGITNWILLLIISRMLWGNKGTTAVLTLFGGGLLASLLIKTISSENTGDSFDKSEDPLMGQ